jgi:hypothetical protein
MRAQRLVSLPVCESLAFESFHSDCSALRVIDAEFCSSIHAEIEFREIPVKVLLVHVLIDANESALEDRKEAFQSVGMHIAARPFVLGVIDRFVLGLIGSKCLRTALRTLR